MKLRYKYLFNIIPHFCQLGNTAKETKKFILNCAHLPKQLLILTLYNIKRLRLSEHSVMIAAILYTIKRRIYKIFGNRRARRPRRAEQACCLIIAIISLSNRPFCYGASGTSRPTIYRNHFLFIKVYGYRRGGACSSRAGLLFDNSHNFIIKPSVLLRRVEDVAPYNIS